MTRMVHCVKLGRDAEGLDFAPWPGDLGKRIYENVSKEAWAQWLAPSARLPLVITATRWVGASSSAADRPASPLPTIATSNFMVSVICLK